MTDKEIKDWKKNTQSEFLKGVIADRAQNLARRHGSNSIVQFMRQNIASKAAYPVKC